MPHMLCSPKSSPRKRPHCGSIMICRLLTASSIPLNSTIDLLRGKLAASGEGGKTRIEEACKDSSAAYDVAYAEIGSSEAIEGATAAAMCNLSAAQVRQVKFCGCCATKPGKRYTQTPCFPRAQPHSES